MPVRYVREIRLGLKTLMLHKLRSLLTMLGVVFGVGSVIAMLAVGEGASRDALAQIRKLGSTNIMVTSIQPAAEAAAQRDRARMSIYGLRYADFDRLSQTIPQVRNVVPVKLIQQQGQFGDRTIDLRLVGTTPNWFSLVRRELLAGRVLNQLDEEERASVVVLTEHGARRLMATQQSMGQSIRIGGTFFEVVGIVQSEQAADGSIQMPDSQVDAYIPLRAAQARFGDTYQRFTAGSRIRERVELHQIIVEADSPDFVERVAGAVQYVLMGFHPEKDFEISVPLALLRQAEATKRTFNIVLGSIAGISLLVGGIGIMNIMLASVTERTREIGIRRAIGARRMQIIRQFLIEAVVLSSAGGLVGVLIGVLIPRIITHFAGMPTVVTVASLVLSLGISMGVGIVFGLYPAARAAQLDPIVALRHE